MKKYLVIMLLCTVMSAWFSSCSKDEEITGTSWVDVEDGVTKTLKFDLSTCMYTLSSTSSQVTISYNYTLIYPVVYMDAQTTGYADLEGTITENKMVVKNTSQNTTIGIFMKQQKDK
jgi:hypothetical protein